MDQEVGSSLARMKFDLMTESTRGLQQAGGNLCFLLDGTCGLGFRV